MIAWLKCFFMGHQWETRTLDERYQGELAYWEDYQVCLKCGADSRPIEAIEDDNYIRLERIEMEIMRRKRCL